MLSCSSIENCLGVSRFHFLSEAVENLEILSLQNFDLYLSFQRRTKNFNLID